MFEFSSKYCYTLCGDYMNKNGFTLVELLAVIIILGIIMAFSVSAVMNTRNKTVETIGKQEKKNIEEAAKMLAVDLDDYMSDVYNCKQGWVVCESTQGKWTEATVTLDDLKSNGYLDDNDSHCGTGDVTITKSDDGYDVDTSKINCTK